MLRKLSSASMITSRVSDLINQLDLSAIRSAITGGVLEAESEEQNDLFDVKFDVTDEGLGLKVQVRVTVTAVNMTRVTQDPFSVPFRAVNGTIAANSFGGPLVTTTKA